MSKSLFLSGVLSTAFLFGCTAAPGGPSPALVEPGTGATLEQLCDENNQTGLNQLATQLEGVDENTDTSALTTAIGTTMADLQSAEVDEGERTVRDAAVTALGQLDTALADPNTRQAAASSAAGALRTAESQLCD